MTNPEQDGFDARTSTEPRASEAQSRRDALRKAAGAAALGGAVWTAPKLKGMSVVPDYASAGTTTTSVITFRLNGEGPSLAGGNNWMQIAPSPAYTQTSANNVTTGGPVSMTAPLGVAGNAVFVFPNQTPTDGGAFDQTVTFHIDPPYNKCVVLGGTADWWGSTSDRGQTSIGGGANVSPNTSSPIVVPVPAPGGSPSAGNNFWNPVTKLNWVEVNIQCQ